MSITEKLGKHFVVSMFQDHVLHKWFLSFGAKVCLLMVILLAWTYKSKILLITSPRSWFVANTDIQVNWLNSTFASLKPRIWYFNVWRLYGEVLSTKNNLLQVELVTSRSDMYSLWIICATNYLFTCPSYDWALSPCAHDACSCRQLLVE